MLSSFSSSVQTFPLCPSIFLTNARSILPKLDELRLSVTALDVQVVIVTESWLCSDVNDDLLRVANFELFRCDRQLRRGGGVCIWSNTLFRPRRISVASCVPLCIEFLIVRLFCGTFSLLCCAIYIPPGLRKTDHESISEFLTNELDELLTLHPQDKVVIAGDFNDFCTITLIENFGLVNRVVEGTRNHSIIDQILLDECLCDCYPNMASVGPPLDKSDHNSILLRAAYQSTLKENGRRPTLVWDFRDSNLLQFLQCLSNTDFNVINQENTVDEMCVRFYELLIYPLSKIPCSLVYFSVKDKPWMTPVLKSLINKRWNAFRDKNWTVYNHYKLKVRSEILKAKRIWCHKQSKTTRGLWSVVRNLRGSNSKEQWQHLLEETGGLQELLNALTMDFSANFNTNDLDLSPLLDQEWNFEITSAAVFTQLSKLKACKATGPDNIPPRLFKVGAQFLCSPLAEIFNLSVRTKTFPMCFKRAHVCPIPKTSKPRLHDFRPISLLSPLSKVFERIIFEHIKLQLFSCYGRHQHAYRPLGSTTSALVDLCEQVTSTLDSNDISHVNIFCLDLSKAFDKLHHHHLLNYLSAKGFNHGFLKWLRSYLCSRTMRVMVLNSLGPIVDVPSGVPQGSVLGPFLFAAFMGSVNFSNMNVKCIKYADDVTLIEPLSVNQVSSVTLDYCVSVFLREGLSVNRSKCKQLHVCFRRSLVCEEDNTGFPVFDSFKILGLIFTDRLTWDMHVSYALKTVSRRMYIIRCMKKCVSKDELIRIYHALVTSVLSYASPVFGLLPTTQLTKLERCQRRAHRMICGPACECDAFPPLSERFARTAVELLLRAESQPNHPLHQYVPERLPSTRRFRNPASNTNRRLNSFFAWACRLFNSSS